MDHRKNFETFTKLGALKDNAIKLCGEQFINNLIQQKINSKNDKFWYAVNQKLGIPDDAYEQMLIQRQEEEERIKAKEKDRIDTLIKNRVLLEIIDRENWHIKVFETFEIVDRIVDKSFFAEAVKLDDPQTTIITDFFNKKKRAISEISSLIDNFEREQRKQRNVKIISQIYLMYLYVSGGDKYNELSRDDPKKKDKETFLGIESWVADFDILPEIDKEGLIRQPQRMGKHPKKVTYIEFTRKGMQTAREALQKVDLEGLADFLREREYHEDYFAQERFNEDED